MKTRLFTILLCLVTITACAKNDNKQNDVSVTTTSENNDEVTTESVVETTEDNEEDSAASASTEVLYTGQELDPIYASFLRGETKVHIDSENDFTDPLNDEFKIIGKKKDFTIDELVNTIIDKRLELRCSDSKFDSIQYASIDCGSDGEKELVLKIRITNPVTDNEEVLIIKNFNGSLKAIYSDVAWCRRLFLINEFGYICFRGGSGTCAVYEKSFVGGDSKWHFLYKIEYSDYANYCNSDNSCSALIQFNKNSDEYSKDTILTLAKDNYDTSDIDFENGYPDYIYDKFPRDESDAVFEKYRDEFKDSNFTTLPLSEVDKMITDKEKAEGLTDEIKNGKTADWKKLDYTLTR
ncbi:hypothetical protein [Butyrivibrio sp. M55]|uniref:hypothetical protein n=1 Tax=Butyrivibrio sp. M55 TaxID=1855323 RepID=UPI0008EF7095|nr:hypothetical protein [Butyrivibrio sp. M55]SFU60017.1 hypothetical protein SAMN05216540_104195 [Butyrivibrio sp. M55]